MKIVTITEHFNLPPAVIVDHSLSRCEIDLSVVYPYMLLNMPTYIHKTNDDYGKPSVNRVHLHV